MLIKTIKVYMPKFQYKGKIKCLLQPIPPLSSEDPPSFPRESHFLYIFLYYLNFFSENIFMIPCIIIKTKFVF